MSLCCVVSPRLSRLFSSGAPSFCTRRLTLAHLRVSTCDFAGHPSLAMPSGRKGKSRGHGGKEETRKSGTSAPVANDRAPVTTEAVTSQLSRLLLPAASSPTPIAPSSSVPPAPGGLKSASLIRSYGTAAGVEVDTQTAGTLPGKGSEESGLSKLFSGSLGGDFSVDTHTYARARIRATFYPKFENEKSDQEVRSRMIELVSRGLAALEVSLKHSGSLFMYAGHAGGAYAKNSFGNIYTAVGVFVLGRMFREAWGSQATRKQKEFNDFLEKNHMCISMELVTAVLGDHGQRPIDDYAVVTAVTELGNGKPKFLSTPDVIAFCRKWRLTTNHIWLFSTRKSVTSFFAAYDALCEEGTATPVCRALDEVADVSVPGSKDHVKVQGEILEGLVARIVNRDSEKHMEDVLKEFPPVAFDGVGHDLGPSLREVCAANRLDEKDQIRSLLKNVGTDMCPDYVDWLGTGTVGTHSRNADRSVLTKFLQARPADYPTTKLMEMIRLMRQRHFPAAFKCYHNFHKIDSLSKSNLDFKMVIHIHSDSVFRRYQQEMRHNSGLWPLYRGFFVDINIFKDGEKSLDVEKYNNSSLNNTSSSVTIESLADEDSNLMIKLKFLTYKIRTFLIRNGLSILFKDGPAAYKTYYLRQMKNWGTSNLKQKELSRMLDEWAVYIRRKCGHKQLSSSTYLTEAEPFLEQYAKRSKENQALIGAAGNLVRTEDFLAVLDADRDEEGDLVRVDQLTPPPIESIADKVPKKEGLIVFFPGIPGCAKSALCRELLKSSSLLGDDRPVHSLMGDMIKGRYWQKVSEERKKRPYTITLADKNAPNEEVWNQIEDMCRHTKASAVPVIVDSEGTNSNPFSLDALAVFIFRVLQRVNHPGNLDKESPNAGYVLLMFYHLYEGKSRASFENELIERFGSLIKMPLLVPDRSPLPDDVKSILDQGMSLYRLHSNKHGRLDPSKGTFAKDWVLWENRLREVMLGNADHLNSIQVPFDEAVERVVDQLKAVSRGEYRPSRGGTAEKRKFGTIVFAAITLPVTDVIAAIHKVAEKDERAKIWLLGKDVECLNRAHVTLAHKRSHGVTAVASYGVYVGQQVDVKLTALLVSENLAAFEAEIGSVEEKGCEKVGSKNEWPHLTVWTGPGASAKDANSLPQLVNEGKAQRVDIRPHITISGSVQFY